jgi:hypothetical protein
MTPEPIEKPRDRFRDADDFESYQRTLDATMKRADDLIARGKANTLSAAEKKELPRVVSKLRELLAIQMDWNGKIAKVDREDGSYDNATIDNQLRVQLRQLRNLDISHNRLWGTRLIRKITSWFSEDVPNWFGVKLEQVKDNLKQVLKVVGVAGALTAGGYATYGYFAGGGAIKGLGLFAEHIGAAGAGIAGGIGYLWNKLRGKPTT